MTPPTARVVADILGEGSTQVMDVGARWGADDAWWRISPLARLIGFEPDAQECKRLNDLLPDSQQVFYPTALGERTEVTTLFETVDPACSSLLPPLAVLGERYPALSCIRQVDTTSLAVTRLDDWWREQAPGAVSFLKLDTQGSELAILQGSGELLGDVLGIEVEVQFTPMYEGAPSFGELDSFLRSHGFVLWRLRDECLYLEDQGARLTNRAANDSRNRSAGTPRRSGRLFWGNAVYFRDYQTIPRSEPGVRKLLILSALLSGLGDLDATAGCLARALQEPLSQALSSAHVSALRTLEDQIAASLSSEGASPAVGLPSPPSGGEAAQPQPPKPQERLRHRLASLAHTVLDKATHRLAQAGARGASGLAASPKREQEDYIRGLPVDACEKRRISMTIACTDCDSIPKHPRAGEVVQEGGLALQIMHDGLRIRAGCYYGRWMTEIIRLLKGHHEPQEERAFHELLRHLQPGSTMVELGSFWGYYSMWFLRQVPQGRCLLVEPDPNNLAVGEENFKLNHLRGEFFNFSVGSEGRPPTPFPCESDGVVRQVPQISLDDLAAANGVTQVDVLLADVQGAELSMLEGCRRVISESRIRFVVLSTHHHSISADPLTHQKCLSFLQDHGATILAQHTIAESHSGDGLIVASLRADDRDLQEVELSRNVPARSLFPQLEYDLAKAWTEIEELKSARAKVAPK